MSILVILSSNTPGCNCMFKKVIKRTHLHPDASYGCIFQIYKRTTSRWSIWIRHPDGLAGSSRCTNEHGHNAIPHHFIYNIMDNKYIQLFKKKEKQLHTKLSCGGGKGTHFPPENFASMQVCL